MFEADPYVAFLLLGPFIQFILRHDPGRGFGAGFPQPQCNGFSFCVQYGHHLPDPWLLVDGTYYILARVWESCIIVEVVVVQARVIDYLIPQLSYIDLLLITIIVLHLVIQLSFVLGDVCYRDQEPGLSERLSDLGTDPEVCRSGTCYSDVFPVEHGLRGLLPFSARWRD